ncbi:RNA polymerase sigma factor [uncultured Sphingomonas sp.]|uniref:RNA polymerase sigma factor n=1 Tax=uncultured Sphingomonas sp. TaxID=158754 RepID=UPI0035CB173B
MTESGLKAVFLEMRPQLLRLLVARLGDRDEAEDALQDMWFRIDQLVVAGPIGQPSAFLYRIATNIATDRRISGQRRMARDTGWVDVQVAAEDLPDAERVLMGREKLAAVEAVIAEMPERMRSALRLFRFEERPQRDIAAELGITVSGVEKLLRRAYKQISDATADFDAGAADRNRLVGERGPST